MLPVSADYQNSILAPTRRVRGKARISYSDPFLDPSVETTVNEVARISWENQVATISIDQEDQDETTIPHKWASLDGTWILDGTYYLAPDIEAASKINHMGWWGSSLAGIDGAFSAPYPTLTTTFSARTVMSLALAGDNKREEYPVDFNIRLYDAYDTLVYTEIVTGNDNVQWFKDYGEGYYTDIVKVELEIKKWSHPGRQVKIAGFFTVLLITYEGDEILELSLLEEREFSAGSLPIGNVSANEITIKLLNDDHSFDAGNTESRLHNLVKMNRKIKAWLGIELLDKTIEYTPLGVFYANEWSVPEGDIYATVTGRDRLDLLTLDTFSSGVLENISLYDLAGTVLDGAGVVTRFIDSELSEFVVPYAYFNDGITYRECLRIIAEASLSQVYMDRSGVLRIEGPSYLTTYHAESITNITRDQYFDKDNPYDETGLANYIEIMTQPLASAPVAEEIYKTEEPEAIESGETKSITIFYTKKPIINAAVTLVDATPGIAISDVAYYAWGATIKFTSTTLGTFRLTATGKPLTVEGARTIIAQDTASIREHGKKIYKFDINPLIQTPEMAQAIAQKCLALSKNSRRDLSLVWRGDPALELGDRITVPDSPTTTADFYVTSNNIEFDGGLQVAIKGKKVL